MKVGEMTEDNGRVSALVTLSHQVSVRVWGDDQPEVLERISLMFVAFDCGKACGIKETRQLFMGVLA